MRTLLTWFTAMCFLLLSVNLAVGCSPQQARSATEVIEKAKIPAFNGAVAAYALLDEAEATRFANTPKATPEELASAERRVQRLELAGEALGELKAWLAGENKDLDFRGRLKEVVDSLDTIARELKNERLPIPKGLDSYLSAARVLL